MCCSVLQCVIVNCIFFMGHFFLWVTDNGCCTHWWGPLNGRLPPPKESCGKDCRRIGALTTYIFALIPSLKKNIALAFDTLVYLDGWLQVVGSRISQVCFASELYENSSVFVGLICKTDLRDSRAYYLYGWLQLAASCISQVYFANEPYEIGQNN